MARLLESLVELGEAEEEEVVVEPPRETYKLEGLEAEQLFPTMFVKRTSVPVEGPVHVEEDNQNDIVYPPPVTPSTLTDPPLPTGVQEEVPTPTAATILLM